MLLEATGRPSWRLDPEALPGGSRADGATAEAWAVIQEVMDQDLTERQRQALKAIVVDEGPASS